MHFNKHHLLGLSTFVFGLSAASANIDLGITLQRLNPPVWEGTTRLHVNATVVIRNAGSDSYRGPVGVRLLMIPRFARRNTALATKGMSLPSSTVDVDLAPGAEASVDVTSIAENGFPGSSYLVGAVLNATRAVEESSFFNNVTADLLPFPGSIPGTPDQTQASSSQDDLYSDIPFVTPANGRAAHGWRLFKRGNVVTPGLHVLFLAVHPESRKLIVADYGNQGEKPVGWANMGQARNEQGETVPFDIYSQNPSFKALQDGTIAMLTLVNSRENIVESNTLNNLDAHFFEARRMLPMPGGALLASSEARAGTPVEVVLPQLTGHFGQLTDIVFDVKQGTHWAELTAGSEGAPPTLRLSAATLEAGIYRTTLTAKARVADETGGSAMAVPVIFEVRAPGTQPGLQTIEQLEMTAIPGQVSQLVRIPVANTGSTPLWFQAEAGTRGLTLGRVQNGFLLPGQTVNLAVRVDLNSAPQSQTGVVVANLRLYSTTSEMKAIQIRIAVTSGVPEFPEQSVNVITSQVH